MPLPLAGLRVLDLSRLLPGPYCSLMLADLGADVVKLEEPSGDYLRWWPPYWPHGATPNSAAFVALNRNKRSIAIDLKKDLALALRIAEKADVLIEGFRPGVMQKLGLGYETLAAKNPRLVMCSISGYGQTGPLSQRAGHDLNYVARSGLLAQNARAGEAPHPLSVQLADLAGGALFPATAILAALYGRERSGKGSYIDAAMSDACVALMPFFAATFAATGAVEPPGTALLHGGVPAYAIYPTADGKFMSVAALEPKFWARLCDALGREDLKAAGLLTGAEGKRTWGELAAIFSSQTQAYWSAQLFDADCCVEPVLSIAEAFADSHHAARGLFMQVEQGGAAMTQVRTPIAMAHVARPAPALDADRETILKDWLLAVAG